MLIFHKVADSGRGQPTSSYVLNSDANVKIGDKFMGRRLHPLNPRRRGGNPNNGKNDINGKNDKIGTDGRKIGRLSSDFLGRQVILQISLPVSRLFQVDLAYRH